MREKSRRQRQRLLDATDPALRFVAGEMMFTEEKQEFSRYTRSSDLFQMDEETAGPPEEGNEQPCWRLSSSDALASLITEYFLLHKPDIELMREHLFAQKVPKTGKIINLMTNPPEMMGDKPLKMTDSLWYKFIAIKYAGIRMSRPDLLRCCYAFFVKFVPNSELFTLFYRLTNLPTYPSGQTQLIINWATRVCIPEEINYAKKLWVELYVQNLLGGYLSDHRDELCAVLDHMRVQRRGPGHTIHVSEFVHRPYGPKGIRPQEDHPPTVPYDTCPFCHTDLPIPVPFVATKESKLKNTAFPTSTMPLHLVASLRFARMLFGLVPSELARLHDDDIAHSVMFPLSVK